MEGCVPRPCEAAAEEEMEEVKRFRRSAAAAAASSALNCRAMASSLRRARMRVPRILMARTATLLHRPRNFEKGSREKRVP